jgi:hypothetical protein
MSESIVTILVALWKASRFLEAKLENLRQQTLFDRCNIVLLNCQNLENEAGIYADFLKHNNVSEICYDTHINLYPTWNDGIKATESRFIMNSNVDDMLHPEYVRACSNWLNTNPDFACVSTGVLVTEKPNQIHPNWEWKDRLPFHIYPLSTAGPCPMWRRSLHNKYDYFGNHRVIGDAKMWEKWLGGGEKFGLIDQNLVLYYAHSGSLERRVDGHGRLYRDIDLEEIKNEKTKKGDGPKNL